MTEKKSPVLVSVTSKTFNEDGQSESMVTKSSGDLSRLGESVLLQYSDHLQEKGEKPILRKVRMFIRPDRVQMHQEGDFGVSSMVFVQGRRFEMKYNTPYGAMDMGVYATQVRAEIGEDSGWVKLQYQIDMSGSYASMMDLNLEWKRVQK